MIPTRSFYCSRTRGAGAARYFRSYIAGVHEDGHHVEAVVPRQKPRRQQGDVRVLRLRTPGPVRMCSDRPGRRPDADRHGEGGGDGESAAWLPSRFIDPPFHADLFSHTQPFPNFLEQNLC
ncbi:hypothetical protein Y032_0005g2659 [Ancylostoma ceylanicum]|uniref:Uncharacterized protein n=1 Tax=Ancylostoma ceylanicum TaxID=53326 RepID=A0A016VSB7_9BILA|nr:hypothetical protein Y032_0005g2659 [Ancylostoma ceylanicum]